MYYVYQHIRLDTNQIFYVGISRWNRQFKYKRASQRDKRNPVWKKIVTKTDFSYEIVFESQDLSLIKTKEIELISKYGKIIDGTGSLANITDGGEGTFGYKHTIENKLKHSVIMKGKKHTEETKEKMRKAQTGKHVPEEVGKKISLAKSGKANAYTHDNSPTPVLHIPTNQLFSSITQAALHFGLRRCTLSRRINSGEEVNFKFL
jgi:group I intron endonuclease